MKKLLICIFLSMFCIDVYLEANNIEIEIIGNTFKVVDPPLKADFSKLINLTFIGEICNGFKIEMLNDNKSLKKQGNTYIISVSNQSSSQIELQLSCSGGRAPFLLSIKNTIPNNNYSIANAHNYFKSIHFKSKEKYENEYRYNRTNNEAYFFFDENGKHLGLKPVNIDADDLIIVYVAVNKNVADSYSIFIEGEYIPSDLVIRGNDTPTIGSQGTGTTSKPKTYQHITKTFGPFTSEKATIKIMKGELEITSLDVRINKLSNVAIGASFISTQLEKPSFDIFPLNDTINTINTRNTGTRTLATLNVIFYWKPTVEWLRGKLKRNSHITRGRDVLKEPLFWERLNPTFGVSLDNDWNENFFIGGNFEFTRGGSLIAGWHYGKTQKLVDQDFILGETPFIGTVDDIKLTNVWEWDFFFGITLDTRIFNSISNRNY